MQGVRVPAVVSRCRRVAAIVFPVSAVMYCIAIVNHQCAAAPEAAAVRKRAARSAVQRRRGLECSSPAMVRRTAGGNSGSMGTAVPLTLELVDAPTASAALEYLPAVQHRTTSLAQQRHTAGSPSPSHCSAYRWLETQSPGEFAQRRRPGRAAASMPRRFVRPEHPAASRLWMWAVACRT